MASAQEQSAPYTVRSSISSIWSNRQKRRGTLTPSQPSPTAQPQSGAARNVVKAGFSALQKNGADGGLGGKRQAGRKEEGRHVEEPRKRDDEAEIWGFEASMGVGAGKSVKKEDREEVLRGRILGKRRWEDANANAKEKKEGKDGKEKKDEGDSDEEVGRSALGRKKRAVRVEAARPVKQAKKDAESEREVEVSRGDADTEMKDAEEKTEDKVGEEAKEKESEGIESSTPAGDAPSGDKRKKKNKKKRKAAAVE